MVSGKLFWLDFVVSSTWLGVTSRASKVKDVTYDDQYILAKGPMALIFFSSQNCHFASDGVVSCGSNYVSCVQWTCPKPIVLRGIDTHPTIISFEIFCFCTG